MAIVFTIASCGSSKNYSTKYYFKNEEVLTSIESTYKDLYASKAFALQFTDRSFQKISIDIITDSIKYVYVFGLNEPARMKDTLDRYGLNSERISKLIYQMQSIKCTWINSLDYYVRGRSREMVFISIRQRTHTLPFIQPKYYILTYFERPQYFDEQGRLMDGRRLRRLRKINGDIFRRINDTVCYTVSKSFR